MKKSLQILIMLVLIGFSKILSAQTPSWVWARSAGEVSNEYSNSVCTDANGNVYITGTFQGSSIIFGNDTLHNAGPGVLDIFVVKYDANGNTLWARGGGGTNDDYAYGICTDANGNVYITGYFRSPFITFGTITLNNADTSISSWNQCDIFITKYDSDGTLLWAKRAGSAGTEISYSICTDSDNNVYITGMFGYSTNMYFASDTLINRGSYDVFVAKYDSGGNELWVKSDGGAEQDCGYSICTDASKNVYVTGYFQASAAFGNDSIFGHGNLDLFVAKYDTYGNNIWAKSAVGPSYDWNSGTGITADEWGNVYITGYFQNSIIFGNDALGNGGPWSIFTAKYDSSGNALWGRSPGGTNNDFGNSISADANGHVFVTGYFASSYLNFGGIPVLNTNVGYNDIFVVEYDAAGNALWATGIGGTDNDYGMGICTNGGDKVYITGYIGSYSVNFGSTALINNGSYDVFLAKLGLTAGIEELAKDTNSVLVYPNPTSTTITFHLSSSPQNETLQITDVFGRVVYKETIRANDMKLDVSRWSGGIYFYEVSGKRGKIVKQ